MPFGEIAANPSGLKRAMELLGCGGGLDEGSWVVRWFLIAPFAFEALYV